MHSLLKESSKKSPFQSKFTATTITREWGLKGLKISMRGGSVSLVLETRFFCALLVALTLYIFGVETENEWIYLLAAGVVTAIMLGLVYPLLQVLDVDASCSLPPDSVSQDRVNLKVHLTRRFKLGVLSHLFPIKWLVVRLNLVRRGDKDSMLRPITVDFLASEAWVVAATPPLSRGVYKLQNIETYSCFPFGLAWWSRSFRTYKYSINEATMTVYAKTYPVDGSFLYRLRASGDVALFFSSTRPIAAMQTSSVRSIREFVSGDSTRMIHWPSSAKAGRLMVREFESEGLPGFDVMLDLTKDWESPEQFEMAVSLVGSLVNLGFRLGGAPELFLVPDIAQEPESLPHFLTDLPPLPPGLGLSAHILARVEPLHVEDHSQTKLPDVGEGSQLALLNIHPLSIEETGAKASQVELWVQSRMISQDPASSDNWSQMKVAMPVHAAGNIDRRQIGYTGTGIPHRVLATLDNPEEIARL